MRVLVARNHYRSPGGEDRSFAAEGALPEAGGHEGLSNPGPGTGAGGYATEAFAHGTPVVASRVGAVAEVSDVAGAGRLFTPGDPDDLVRAVRELLAAPGDLPRRRRAARAEHEARYTGEHNLTQLLDIHEMARNR